MSLHIIGPEFLHLLEGYCTYRKGQVSSESQILLGKATVPQVL